MSRASEHTPPSSKMTEILKAIGNAKRLQILNELAQTEELSVSQLELLVMDLSQSALSQHLGRLRRANIVRTRRASQTIYYSLADDDVRMIMRLLSSLYIDDPVIRTRH